jgi:ABC-type phosphate/phosphonate transport system substrate-binding protein
MMNCRAKIGWAVTCFVMIGVAAAAPVRPTASVVKVGLEKALLRDLSPQLFQVLAISFQTVMEAQTGLAGQLLAIDSADEVRRRLVNGEMELGVVCGVEYGWMNQKHPELEPLMLSVTDRDALEAVIVVAKDAQINCLKDCQGKRLAIPIGTRGDTRLFLSERCRCLGHTIHEFFAKMVMPHCVEEALDNVVDGVVDAAVVDRAGLKMFERRKPGRYPRLAVIAESGTFPPCAIVFRRGKIDEATLTKFRDGMVTAHKTVLGAHLMTLMNIKRFELATGDYQKQVDEAVKAYPSPESNGRLAIPRGLPQ